jgi:ABC-type nitrate/sulfonate/bicarbonate transport system substrate-binding protein
VVAQALNGCRPTPAGGRSPEGIFMIRITARWLFAIVFAVAAASRAQAPERIVFATDWLAEAEHGGYYQALAEGTYGKYGLDVTIKMGGPQVNGLRLLAAGQLDVVMGDALQGVSAVEQGVPLVAVAATFQKNPTAIIAHPGVASLADLKGKPIAIGAASNTTFWPWLKKRYGFTDDQKRPYGFSVQPFLADPALSQQGFATSEPFSIEKGGVKPVVFLLADLGYPPYAEVLVVTRATLDNPATRSRASSAPPPKAGRVISPIRRPAMRSSNATTPRCPTISLPTATASSRNTQSSRAATPRPAGS